MRELSKDEFDAIITEHNKWLADRSTGRRGDFAGVELIGFDLPIHCTVSGCTVSSGTVSGGKVSQCTVSLGEILNKPVSQIKGYAGLYAFNVWSVLMADGSRWVRMGCLFKSLEEWEKIGIRNSNPSSFPDDRSDRSEDRVAAFEFAKAAALRMKMPGKEQA